MLNFVKAFLPFLYKLALFLLKLKQMKEYNSPSAGKLDLNEVAKEIATYVQQNPDEKYQLIVGTDSEGNGKVEFVTAIVIYRQGKGGRYFYKKFSKGNIKHLRHKIYEEVNASLEAGQNLIVGLQKYWKKDNIKGALEIHIDIGENGPTKDLIKEVMGMVLGQGFRAKIKPYSYGASLVADRHV
jgi:predicted RNase H-related nuclease YkuK (DUF458 family)